MNAVKEIFDCLLRLLGDSADLKRDKSVVSINAEFVEREENMRQDRMREERKMKVQLVCMQEKLRFVNEALEKTQEQLSQSRGQAKDKEKMMRREIELRDEQLTQMKK